MINNKKTINSSITANFVKHKLICFLNPGDFVQRKTIKMINIVHLYFLLLFLNLSFCKIEEEGWASNCLKSERFAISWAIQIFYFRPLKLVSSPQCCVGCSPLKPISWWWCPRRPSQWRSRLVRLSVRRLCFRDRTERWFSHISEYPKGLLCSRYNLNLSS